MSPTRARWLETAQVARSEGGAEALALLRALPPAARKEVLSFGERFAERSLAAAQSYALRAPAARQRLDARRFSEWAETGLEVAESGFDGREAAAAFFRLDPETLLSVDRGLRRRWIDLYGEVRTISRRLAGAYLESSGRALRALGTGGADRLEAWVRAGVALARDTGWRGEFLAAAYFGSGSEILVHLHAEEIAGWAELGARVQVGREISHGFFRALPPGFAALPGRERRLVLATCLRAAEASPRTAADLFAALSGTVVALTPEVRRPLLEAFHRGSKDADGILRVLPLLAAIVRSVPPEAARVVFARVSDAAKRFPAGLTSLLRSLPRALGETDVAGVLEWVRLGEAIAVENPEAGAAYFALESRTAVQLLRDTSAAARLDETHGILRSYARMLSGRRIEIRPAVGPSLRPFLDLESLDRASFALPERVDVFGSWEENFSLLKLMTANGVGRILFGTFDLRLGRVWERLPAPLAASLSSIVPGERLRHLLEAVPEADPLIALFTACEGARIDARLCALYRGYAAELAIAARRLRRALGRRRPAAELALCLLGAGEAPRTLASRELPATVLETAASVLLSPAATVEDALATAILLRERLEESLVVSGVGAPTSYEELLFERMAGETMLDPQYAEGQSESSAGASEVLDVEPSAVEEGDEDGRGTPLSAEELRRLLQAGAIVRVGRGEAEEESAGIFATGLSLAAGEETETEGELPPAPLDRRASYPPALRREFEYDEWDHQIDDYRRRWCRLEEVVLDGDAGEFFQQTLSRYAELLPEVRRQFQRIRPERYRKVRGLEDGEDFDLNAVVEARTELRARRTPSSRLYVARRREERDVATLFLLDMSASTDESVGTVPTSAGEDGEARGVPARRRIIDITKEALVIMAEALDELGDRYAIYGFSGQGRRNVEFYPVKLFNDGLTPAVRGRIGGIEPRRSTRMGTALRHAITKMTSLAARSKHILLLSDGFPQDFDYGTDRRSNTYGIQDTMMALQECQTAGITPFCITVDKTGHDYLREMCESSRYLVIEDVESLPTELPKIYERWIHA